MSELKRNARLIQARRQYRDVAVVGGMLAIASLGLAFTRAQAPWASLFLVPVAYAAFRSRSEALLAAAVSGALYLGLVVALAMDEGTGLASPLLQAATFFGFALVLTDLVRRRARRQKRREEEDNATRASLDIQHMINTAYDTEVTLDLVILKQREVLKADSYAVLLAENNVLRLRVSSGLPAEDRAFRLGVQEEDHGWAPADGCPLMVADTSTTDTRLSGIDPEARSILLVPLHSVERLVGLLFFGSRQADAFAPDVIALSLIHI